MEIIEGKKYERKNLTKNSLVTSLKPTIRIDWNSRRIFGFSAADFQSSTDMVALPANNEGIFQLCTGDKLVVMTSKSGPSNPDKGSLKNKPAI